MQDVYHIYIYIYTLSFVGLYTGRGEVLGQRIGYECEAIRRNTNNLNVS